MGENICKQCDQQRINLQSLDTAHEAQSKKNFFNQKMGRRPKQTFLQRRHTYGQEAHEMIFNITSYQRNASQNYEIPPHTKQNGHHQKFYKQ